MCIFAMRKRMNHYGNAIAIIDLDQVFLDPRHLVRGINAHVKRRMTICSRSTGALNSPASGRVGTSL
jgi:hypothetical protein